MAQKYSTFSLAFSQIKTRGLWNKKNIGPVSTTCEIQIKETVFNTAFPKYELFNFQTSFGMDEDELMLCYRKYFIVVCVCAC